MSDKNGTVLSALLIATKDGDWGSDSSAIGLARYFVIRGTDFTAARFGDISSIPKRYLNTLTAKRRTLEPDDVIIETAGGSKDRSTGRTLLVNEHLLRRLGGPATCASFARFIRVDREKADPRYIYWYLQFLHQSGEMWKHQVQHTGIARFQYTRFAETHKIPLPSREQQEEIAGFLESLDNKIRINERISTAIDVLTQGIFRETFSSSRNESLNDWNRGRLADICTTQYGYTASASDKPDGPKFLRVKDINKRNWIEWESVPYCAIPDRDYSRYALSIGDIVVARMADPGKSAIIEKDIDGIFASYLVRLKATSLSRAYYVYGFLKSPEYVAYVEQSKSGSVQANMNAKVISAAELDIPPEPLMESYLARVLPLRQRLMSTIDETAALARLRDTLLPKLMLGEIRFRDAAKVVEETT